MCVQVVFVSWGTGPVGLIPRRYPCQQKNRKTPCGLGCMSLFLACLALSGSSSCLGLAGHSPTGSPMYGALSSFFISWWNHTCVWGFFMFLRIMVKPYPDPTQLPCWFMIVEPYSDQLSNRHKRGDNFYQWSQVNDILLPPYFFCFVNTPYHRCQTLSSRIEADFYTHFCKMTVCAWCFTWEECTTVQILLQKCYCFEQIGENFFDVHLYIYIYTHTCTHTYI